MDISKAKYILDYWLPENNSADYDKWFLKSSYYDAEITAKFGDLLKEAENGRGYGWLVNKDSFIAYIILMDQFSRHIYRGHADAFKNDIGVMLFTELGFELYQDQFTGYEFMFAFMPYMHTECLSYQIKGKQYFNKHLDLYQNANTYTHRATLRPLTDYNKPLSLGKHHTLTQNDKDYKILKTMESRVMGNCFTIQLYGRFPTRNKVLSRKSTEKEILYMDKTDGGENPI